jgi:hypothetical protein
MRPLNLNPIAFATSSTRKAFPGALLFSLPCAITNILFYQAFFQFLRQLIRKTRHTRIQVPIWVPLYISTSCVVDSRINWPKKPRSAHSIEVSMVCKSSETHLAVWELFTPLDGPPQPSRNG